MTDPLTPDRRQTPVEGTDDAALRDAEGIADRIGEDEAAADAERARLVEGELPSVQGDIDPTVGVATNEAVHAVRRAAILENGSGIPVGGALYLTSRRLIHLGQARHDVPLETIAETAVALERLLLVDLEDGSGLAIEIDQPRLLRVQLAAARANARRRPR